MGNMAVDYIESSLSICLDWSMSYYCSHRGGANSPPYRHATRPTGPRVITKTKEAL